MRSFSPLLALERDAQFSNEMLIDFTILIVSFGSAISFLFFAFLVSVLV